MQLKKARNTLCLAVIKMMVMPKLMFLLQNLPVAIPDKQFKEWEGELKHFVWKGFKPRIKWNNLKETKEKGGYALPDLKIYYWACSLVWIQNWIKLEEKEVLDLEDIQLRFGWHAFLNYNMLEKNRDFNNHPIRKSLLTMWKKIKKLFYFKIPIWSSPQEAFFSRWLGNSDIKWLTYKNSLKKDQSGKVELKSREALKEEGFNLHWFTYYQIKSRFVEDSKQIGIEPEFNDLDIILWQVERKKKISKLYKLLLNRILEQEVVKDYMIKWAQDLGQVIELEEWHNAWKKTNDFTIAQEPKENFLKIMNRWYCTPWKLKVLYKLKQGSCWRCGHEKGNLIIYGGIVKKYKSSGGNSTR